MASCNLTLVVKFKWWVMPYIKTLILFCRMTNQEPDWEKLEKIINHAIKVRVKNGKR